MLEHLQCRGANATSPGMNNDSLSGGKGGLYVQVQISSSEYFRQCSGIDNRHTLRHRQHLTRRHHNLFRVTTARQQGTHFIANGEA